MSWDYGTGIADVLEVGTYPRLENGIKMVYNLETYRGLGDITSSDLAMATGLKWSRLFETLPGLGDRPHMV